jgi:hypothetical protein
MPLDYVGSWKGHPYRELPAVSFSGAMRASAFLED